MDDIYLREGGLKMIISISVAASAIAFIVLVYYVVRVLMKGMGTLSETNKTLSEVRNAIQIQVRIGRL